MIFDISKELLPMFSGMIITLLVLRISTFLEVTDEVFADEMK